MYRKFKADQIFTGYAMVAEDQVLVTHQDGTVRDLVSIADAGDDIEILRGTISPGFINCHCHLELSHLKGLIPKQTGLVDFILKVVSVRHAEAETIVEAIQDAEAIMAGNGIVAVGDICNTAFSISQKAKGNLQYHNFIEATGFIPGNAQSRFQDIVNLYHEFSRALKANTIVPHAPYSVSPGLLQLINAFPGNHIQSIHNQETQDENDFFQQGKGEFLRLFEQMNIDISFFKPTGRSSLQSYLPFFTNGQSVMLVHNVTTGAMDASFASVQAANHKLKVYFCLCPNANLYISNRLPDMRIFDTEGEGMVLGTDSLASNDQLCILEEMKTIRKHFPGISTAVLLKWATSNGANALGISDRFGSFEKGKKPGVLLIDPEFSKVKRIV